MLPTACNLSLLVFSSQVHWINYCCNPCWWMKITCKMIQQKCLETCSFFAVEAHRAVCVMYWLTHHVNITLGAAAIVFNKGMLFKVRYRLLCKSTITRRVQSVKWDVFVRCVWVHLVGEQEVQGRVCAGCMHDKWSEGETLHRLHYQDVTIVDKLYGGKAWTPCPYS